MEVALRLRFESHDRVADELARLVAGDVAAAARLLEVEPPPGDLLRGEEEVVPSAAGAESDDGTVLEDPERVRKIAPAPELDEDILRLVRARVGNTWSHRSRSPAKSLSCRRGARRVIGGRARTVLEERSGAVPREVASPPRRGLSYGTQLVETRNS